VIGIIAAAIGVERKAQIHARKRCVRTICTGCEGANDSGQWDWNLKTNELIFSRWKAIPGCRENDIEAFMWKIV